MKTIARTQEEGRTADEDPTVRSGGQGGELLHQRIPLWHDQYGPQIVNMIDAALKRIQVEEYGVCANCQEEMQQKRLGSGTVGEALHQLPGKNGTGIVAVVRTPRKDLNTESTEGGAPRTQRREASSRI